MHWYEGGIAEAVAVSKGKGAIFVVYVEGQDANSIHITELINSEEVSNKLGSEHFVAIKVEANSLPHQQFKEIYKQVPAPSIFFIGKNGVPLETITEAADTSALSAKIDLVLQKAGVSASPAQSAAQQSANLLKSEQQSTAPENVVCENGVCYKPEPSTSKADTVSSAEATKPTTEGSGNVAESTTSSTAPPEKTTTELPKQTSPEKQQPKVEAAAASSPKVELTAEEKVQRAKELIEQQKIAKQKEEEEKERLKEMERRKAGQGMQQLKKWQEDQELKQFREEREREKRENQAARDRVLAQIAQDKAERAAKFSSSPPAKPTTQQQQSTSKQPERKAQDSTVAKLQFRLPDGTSHTQEFSVTESLKEVRSYVYNNMDIMFDFTLATAFPRREFTHEDDDKTLLDLQLVPNAVILILRTSNRAVTVSTGGVSVSSFIWALFAPIINMLSYLKNWVFGGGNSQAAGDKNKRSAEKAGVSSRVVTKRIKESTVIKRQGNVHRLSDNNDTDDENNTWNGNSTQQM